MKDWDQYQRGQKDMEMADRRRAVAKDYLRIRVEDGLDPDKAIDELAETIKEARVPGDSDVGGWDRMERLVARMRAGQ